MTTDAFAQVTRAKVDRMGEELKEFKGDVKDFMARIDGRFDKLEENLHSQLEEVKDKQTDLFNHQSSRIPPEISKKLNLLYGILGTIFGGVVIAIVGAIL